MLLTRWKLMAGILGVSIGGLAAAASQCPKFDKTKGRQPDAPVTAEAPKVAPAGAPSVPPALPMLPTPDAPKLPDAPKPPAALPAIPDFTPATGEPKTAKPADIKPVGAVVPLPTVPEVPSLPAPTDPKPLDVKPVVMPPMTMTADVKLPTVPPPAVKPTIPDATKPADLTPPPSLPAPIPSKPTLPPPGATPPAPILPTGGTTQPPETKVPPAPQPEVTPPPASLPSPKASDPVLQPPKASEPPAGVIDVPPSRPQPAPPADAGNVKVGQLKYRILLRVGEGEPTFEVKSGDDLVLKVACEKVDIKSPEKGAGPSAVTAKGKVRFAGFGVEGTCDELSFMAGTGEVSMAGDVKVQMKDKLGRVESELSTSTLKYKIDASVIGNALKP